MTKKDYILIANAIRDARESLLYASVNPGETKRSIEIVTDTLGVALKKENDRFDPKRFDEYINKPA